MLRAHCTQGEKMLKLFKKTTESHELKKAPGVKTVLVAYIGNGSVPYFEQAEYFEVYSFKSGERIKKELIHFPKESAHDRVSRFHKMYIDAVICRGFGPRAIQEMKRYRIKAYEFDGGPAAASKAWQRGDLKPI